MPWRSDPTPYHVWVSEIMLQQTQVATVIDYYHRFMDAFPSVASLAAADEESLMRIWEGLGYYRRAKMMHQAAKRIVAQHDGKFPVDYGSVIALPGIGRYTAGAILSIASDASLPILEGNTVRVFSRWVAIGDDVKSPAGIKHLWQIAESMVPEIGAGRFNQAAMELGALICRPVAPRCNACPVAKQCVANQRGLQDSIPGKVTKTLYEDRREVALVIPNLDSDAWLIRRVPDGERWAGLWDFPRGIADADNGPKSLVTQTASQTGLPIVAENLLATMKHAVTKFRITLDVYAAEPVDASLISTLAGEFRFVTAGELVTMPLNVTGRKIAAMRR